MQVTPERNLRRAKGLRHFYFLPAFGLCREKASDPILPSATISSIRAAITGAAPAPPPASAIR